MNNLLLLLLLTSLNAKNWDNSLYKGNRSYSQYTQNTVKDNLTDLIWEKNRSEHGLMWGEAEGYCMQLSLDGYDDWRLPTYEELYYLADRKKFSPSIDENYFDEDGEWYWSATLYKFQFDTAWLVSFTSGYDSYQNKVNLNFARCVRNIDKSKNINEEDE